MRPNKFGRTGTDGAISIEGKYFFLKKTLNTSICAIGRNSQPNDRVPNYTLFVI